MASLLRDPSDTPDDEVGVGGMESWCATCRVIQETKKSEARKVHLDG